MIRSICLAALLLGLAACEGEGPAPDVSGDQLTEDAPVVIAFEPAPVPVEPLPTIVEQASETYQARAEFPYGLNGLAPELDARLRANAVLEFEQLAAAADTYATEDPDYFRPYTMTISWTQTGTAGDLVSLEGFTYTDAGGAHGNYYLSGLIHDRIAGEDIGVLDLFTDGSAGLAVLLPAVRGEITKEKMVRYGEEGEPTQARLDETAESLPDHGRWLSETVLVPSDQAGLFGGVKVHFSPYELGSYAEGSYEALVPQAVFRDALKAEYQGLFAGQPAPYGED